MKSKASNFKRASRVFAATALLLSAVATPSLSFAAGPGGLLVGFGSTVSRIAEHNRADTPFAGVSDPISFHSMNNINTRGFALRKDGAY